MIKLQFIGNLGADAVRKEINGDPVLNFRAAHSYRYKNPDGSPNERTTWVNCAYWGEKDLLMPFMTKGRQVFVEGIPTLDMYVTNSGEPTPAINLRVTNVQLLSKPRSAEETEDVGIAEDLPF